MKGRKLTASERKIKAETNADERKRIFKELCKHLESGYSLDCFGWLSSTTINKYLIDFPNEFVKEEFEEAQRKGKQFWENIGHRQANGSCMGNSRTWYYNMANRYGWREKIEVEAEHKGSVNINVVSYATSKRCSNTVSND